MSKRMKIIKGCLAAFIGLSMTAQAELLVSFDFAGAAGNEVTSNANLVATGIDAPVTISRGSGIAPAANADRFNANGWGEASAADALTNGDYFEWTITPSAGSSISITQIAFQVQRSNTGASNLVLRTSADSYTADLNTLVNFAGNNATVGTTNDTSVVGGLQNTSLPITIRVIGWTGASGGSLGFEGPGNDIRVWGTVDAGPPPPPATNVQFVGSAATVGEDAGTYDITIIKTVDSGDVSGQIQLGGTATLGDDYTLSATNFTLNGATTSTTVTVTIVDDGDEESSETVILTLVNVTGGGIGSPSVFTLTIEDNDSTPPPAGSIVIDFEGVGETKGSYAAGSVTLSGLSWEIAEGLIGTSASDRKNGARSARLRTNDLARMTLLEDITNGVGTVTFLHAVYGTDGNSALELEYSINGGSSWISVDSVTNASSDLTLFSADVNQPGNVRLRITKIAGNAASRANVDDIIIAPFDGPPPPPATNVSFAVASASVGEGDGEYVVTVTKSLAEGNVSGEITLGGTATEGDDYSINTTNFTMNGATTSATFTITIVDDAEVEGNETVILSLVNVTGGTVVSPSVFTLTIVDNDEPPPPPPPAGAIAYYTFTGSNVAPEFVAANANATTVSVTAGSITFSAVNAASWTNASGVPHIRGSGGWTASVQSLAKAFELTVTADSGYVMTITNVSFYYRTSAAGPTAIGFSLDGSSIIGGDATSNATTFVTQPVTGYDNVGSVVLSIQGWTNGWRASTGGGTLDIDDILVQGFITAEGGPITPDEKEIIAITIPGGVPTVRLGDSQSGVNYQFRYTTNLSTPQTWTPIGAAVPGTGADLIFTDPSASDPARLYHVDAIAP